MSQYPTMPPNQLPQVSATDKYANPPPQMMPPIRPPIEQKPGISPGVLALMNGKPQPMPPQGGPMGARQVPGVQPMPPQQIPQVQNPQQPAPFQPPQDHWGSQNTGIDFNNYRQQPPMDQSLALQAAMGQQRQYPQMPMEPPQPTPFAAPQDRIPPYLANRLRAFR